MTITGQSCPVSKFAGTAIVTSACLTGDRLPRPASSRSSVGSSTWNSLKPPALRPVAASAPDATNNAGSNAGTQFMNTRVYRSCLRALRKPDVHRHQRCNGPL